METFLLWICMVFVVVISYFAVKNGVSFLTDLSAGKAGKNSGCVIPSNSYVKRNGQTKRKDAGKAGSMRKTIAEDFLKSMLILVVSTAVCFAFDRLEFGEANINMVYILGVLITAIVTSRQAFSLVNSIISVLLFNFLFTEPRFTFKAYDAGYWVTFTIMFLVAFLVSSLTVRMKEQARKSEEAALIAEKEKLRANLLRSISHDLRTPLTSISGNAGILLSSEENLPLEKRKQLYEDIRDDALWLIGLVENLLAVTRIEDGTMKLNRNTELLDEIITEALQHTDRRRDEHQIQVKSIDAFLLVKVDARLIMQVIVNLVDNAIKYTKTGSDIVIEAKKEGEWAVVTVSDNGEGIPDEKKNYIFDMFYTADTGVADSRRSLGLGLALCKTIITAHGGSIRVSDNEPHGAVFTFTLPIEEVSLHE